MSRIIDRFAFAIIGALALALLAVMAGLAGAGPLNPTTPPGSTDSVRLPGTPISSLPFTINAPGNYYVTRDLTANGAGVDGITINTSNVTIDLGGFALHGGAGTDDGIVSIFPNTSVRNGALDGWDGDGLNLTSASGEVHNVTVANVSGRGVSVGSQFVIREVIVRDAGTAGIVAGSNTVIRDCVSVSNGADGVQAQGGLHIEGCTIQANSGDGIEATFSSFIAGNALSGNGAGAPDGAGIHVTGDRNRIEDNNVIGNDRGIDVDMAGNVIVRNSLMSNTVAIDAPAGTIVGGAITSANVNSTFNPHGNYFP